METWQAQHRLRDPMRYFSFWWRREQLSCVHRMCHTYFQLVIYMSRSVFVRWPHVVSIVFVVCTLSPCQTLHFDDTARFSIEINFVLPLCSLGVSFNFSSGSCLFLSFFLFVSSSSQTYNELGIRELFLVWLNKHTMFCSGRNVCFLQNFHNRLIPFESGRMLSTFNKIRLVTVLLWFFFVVCSGIIWKENYCTVFESSVRAINMSPVICINWAHYR